VPGHTGELNQVWTNLIDNAAQAMAYDGVLTVGVQPCDGGVEVVIADTGPGIPDDVRPHVFEAFFTTKPAGEGSGLGLEIAHRIVTQRLRGTIEIDTSPAGTQLRVWLPGDPDHPARVAD
jgi:signal transduction histidine kinase